MFRPHSFASLTPFRRALARLRLARIERPSAAPNCCRSRGKPLDRRWQITFTLGILAIAPLARIVRAQTLTLREREYVLAARSLGATTGRVLAREILPNLVPTMLTVAFTGLGILIAAEGALAFLGLSVEAPTPTWGKLIDQNRTAMNLGWWATVFPCIMLFLTVLSFNLIGEWLSKRFDIRGAAI